jgi:2-polyprenyl-3-methyl-5-hydroxy-6-metoxy-1,4-benzoquinol methylase
VSDAAAQAKRLQIEAAERFRGGDLESARKALLRAVEIAPDVADYHINLAELARARGDREAAAGHLVEATRPAASAPDARALNLLAAGWLDLGRSNEAVEAAAAAVQMADSVESRRLFAEAFKGATRLRPEHRGLVARAVAEAWTGVESLQRPAANLLRATWPGDFDGLAADPLLAALLVSGPIRDPDLERRLTVLRRALLFGPADERLLPLRARLAIQCFSNEYAWAQDDDETAKAAALQAGPAASDPTALLMAACYAPLYERADAAALLGGNHGPQVRAVLERQIAEPLADRAAAEQVATLAPIHRAVSGVVRAQYETNPYPRWTNATAQQMRPLAQVMADRFPRAAIAPVAGGRAPHVLIAGCGTGQHAIQAAKTYQDATVLAVDLSRASLGHAVRKARELGVENITFAQADLLDLADTGRTFDVIECSGVLHHLADPFEGVRALAGMLKPGGVMFIGVYSAAARRLLAAAKALARDFPATTEGIRKLRQAVLAMPSDDPVAQARGFGDFFSLSTCRDLLMHVQEHEMDLGDLRRMIAESGLNPLGFILPPAVLTAYASAYPDDPAGTDLDNWAAFEAGHPATFAAMYQLWAQRPGPVSG